MPFAGLGVTGAYSTRYVSIGAFFDGGLSELFGGVPVPVPVRDGGEREPELEEAGAIGRPNPGPGFGQKRSSEADVKLGAPRGRQRV